MDGMPHDDIIAAVRGTGAAVRLISDGDVADVIYTADSDNSGVDIYMSAGGAPEARGRQLRYVVSAARCNADWCSTPMKGASEPQAWVLATAEDILDRRHGEGRLPICGDWRYRPCTGGGCLVS
jgi:fructose-1,6-bisphosphatase/sedoheptulose 1,7-bisphosphatase-like protein